MHAAGSPAIHFSNVKSSITVGELDCSWRKFNLCKGQTNRQHVTKVYLHKLLQFFVRNRPVAVSFNHLPGHGGQWLHRLHATDELTAEREGRSDCE